MATTNPTTSIDNANQPVELQNPLDKFKVMVDNEIYPVFIKNKNFKSEIVISPAQARFERHPISNQMSNGERYDIVLPPRSLISTGVRHGCEYLELQISNIDFSSDTFDNYKMVGSNIGLHSDNGLFLPVPYADGISGFAIDPLNNLIDNTTVKFGSSQMVQTYITDELLNFDYMRYNEHEIKKKDPLLSIDTLADLSPFNIQTCPKYYQSGTGDVHYGEVPYPKGSRCSELLMNEYNPIGVRNRFRKADKITFSKSSATNNYSFDGTWTVSGSSTNLYTIVIDGVVLPSNVDPASQARARDAAVDPRLLIYFKGKIGPIHTASPTGLSGLTADNVNINQTVRWNNLETCLKADCFSEFNHGSFSNVDQLYITKTFVQDKRTILRSLVPYSNSLTQINTAVGGTLASRIYPHWNNLQVEVKIQNPYVLLKQIDLPLELRPQSLITIPFLKRDIIRNTYDMGGATWASKCPIDETTGKRKPFTLRSNRVSLSRLPKATLVYINCRDRQFENYINSGLQLATIQGQKILIGNSNPICDTWGEMEWYNNTKRNNLPQYRFQDIDGYHLVVPDYNKGDNYVKNGYHLTKTFEGKYEKQNPKGTLIFFQWSDIPLPSSLSASVGGLQTTIQYEWLVSAPWESRFCEYHVVDFYENEMKIAEDTQAYLSEELFTQKDVMMAINKWATLTKGDSLYINTNHLKGGGLISWLGAKIPKVLSSLWNNRDAIQSAVSNAKGIYDSVKQGMKEGSGYKMDGGAKSLAQLMNE